jgi:endonuclease/exonuclease/phosphatase family metal-dependent hydrolase
MTAPFRTALAPLAALVLSLLAACVTPPSARPVVDPAPFAPPAPLRVMTFNLRYDTPSDSGNAWPHRRDWVASLIRFHAPDVVGVQEALLHQLTDLDARVPEFARVGVGRADGRTGGEFSAILYRRNRLHLLDSGTFWLSPTPEIAGSKGWDAAIERVATWARVRDRRTGCRFLLVNTHFDHVGEMARQQSARLIRRRAAALADGLPVILTGDLNAIPASEPYRIMTRDTIAGTLPLRDAFSASRAGHYGPTSTWTDFRAIEPGRRIDYVLVSPGVTVLKHGILPDSWNGRFPSDHLPVVADVERDCD